MCLQTTRKRNLAGSKFNTKVNTKWIANVYKGILEHFEGTTGVNAESSVSEFLQLLNMYQN